MRYKFLSAVLVLWSMACFAKTKYLPWRTDLIEKGLDTKRPGFCRFSQDGEALVVGLVPKGQEAWPENPDTQAHFNVYNRRGAMVKEFALPKADRVLGIALQKNAELLAVCQRNGTQNELLLWSGSKRSTTNIFELSGINCSRRLSFVGDELYLISRDENANLAIWHKQDGVRKKLPEVFTKLHCLEVSPDLQSAYCIDSSKNLAKVNIDSGKAVWLTKPSAKVMGKPWQQVAQKVSKAIKVELPKFFFYLAQNPPEASYLDKDNLYLYYRVPTRDRESGETHAGYFLIYDSTTGALKKETVLEEDPGMRLFDLRLNMQEDILIGYDDAGQMDAWNSFVMIKPVTGGTKRFSNACSNEWDYVPHSKEILSCGFCEGKASLKLWKTI